MAAYVLLCMELWAVWYLFTGDPSQWYYPVGCTVAVCLLLGGFFAPNKK